MLDRVSGLHGVVVTKPHPRIARDLPQRSELRPFIRGEVGLRLRHPLKHHRRLHRPTSKQRLPFVRQERFLAREYHPSHKRLDVALERAHPPVVALRAWHPDRRLKSRAREALRPRRVLNLHHKDLLFGRVARVENQLP